MFFCSVMFATALLSMASPKGLQLEDVPLIPRKEIFGNPDYSQPKISPNGELLAYLAPNKREVMNVWIRTIGKKDDRLITNDSNRGITNLMWQGDNEHIIYLKDKGGNQAWHVFQTNITTKRTRDLTPYENVQAKILSYDLTKPHQILLSLNKRDPQVSDAYILNLKDAELVLKTESNGNISQFVTDHSDQVRAALRVNRNGTHTVIYRETEKGKWENLMDWDLQDQQGFILGFNPKDTALWVVTSAGANTKRLVQIDLKTKNQVILFEHPEYDINEVLIHLETKKIQAVNVQGKYLDWSVLDPKIETEFQSLLKAFPGNVEIVNSDLKGRFWVFSVMKDIQPKKYFLYDRVNKKTTFLFDSRKKLNQYQFAKTWPFSFNARDGMKIHGFYTLPPIKKQKFPTVVLVHGGPYRRDNWKFSSIVQWLANRGYAVIQVNFRGSIGYGKEYLNAARRQWASRMHTDLIDAKNWAIEQQIADPKKIAIMGKSYGGYAALVGLSFTPKDFCCGVSFVGPSNLVTLLKSIPPHMYPEKVLSRIFVGDPEKESIFLKKRSPLFKADEIQAPVFIAQGVNDPVVAQKESDQIVKALRKLKLNVEYLLFPDEGHEIIKPINRLKYFAATEKFLSQYLEGRREDPSPNEDWQSVKN